MKSFLLYFSLISLSANAHAQPGSADSSFGNNGVVSTTVGSGNDHGRAMIIQSDGKIVVGGDTYTNNTVQEDFALLRFNVDGSLDTDFGISGKVVTDLQLNSDAIKALAIQPDGKIVAAGHAHNGNNYDFAATRYLSDGSLDNSFGAGGKVLKNLGSTDFCLAMALLPDGRILLAGRSYNGQDSDFALFQMNSDGTPDNSFGNAGTVKSDLFGADENANALAIQADGKIVVAGDRTLNNISVVAVARFNPNGSLDTSFGSGGKITANIGSLSDVAYAVAVQPDGKIVVGGQSNSATVSDFALFRFLADGTPDLAFNGSGQLSSNISNSGDYIYGLAIQPDGKILAGGNAGGNSSSDLAVMRYHSNGAQDHSFGNNGLALIDVANGYDVCTAMALRQNKILLAGFTENSSKASIVVSRLLNDANVGTLSIIKPDILEKIAVAPNPSSGVFELQWAQQEEGPGSIELYNEKGTRLYYRDLGRIAAGQTTQIIDLGQELPNGLYLARIGSNGESCSVFLVLQR